MVQVNDGLNLKASWRALSGSETNQGWRTIPIHETGKHVLLAGRHFPDDMEAILVGFENVSGVSKASLPQGRGFSLEFIQHNLLSQRPIWLCLSRLPTGNLDIFSLMSEDIILTIKGCAGRSDQEVFQIFISRIQAWQYFMDEVVTNVLSPESEIGLFGELTVLKKMIDLGATSGSALATWQGPLNGLHDFRINDGGIEIKTTASAAGFPARIGSLDQLDNSAVRPLFLAGVRLSASPDGETLTSLVNSVRQIFRNSHNDLHLLNCRLLQVGFLDAFADKYTSKYRLSAITAYRVDDAFPCLTRNKVPSEIRSLQYVLDLSMLAERGLELEVVLKELRDK